MCVNQRLSSFASSKGENLCSYCVQSQRSNPQTRADVNSYLQISCTGANPSALYIISNEATNGLESATQENVEMSRGLDTYWCLAHFLLLELSTTERLDGHSRAVEQEVVYVTCVFAESSAVKSVKSLPCTKPVAPHHRDFCAPLLAAERMKK